MQIYHATEVEKNFKAEPYEDGVNSSDGETHRLNACGRNKVFQPDERTNSR